MSGVNLKVYEPVDPEDAIEVLIAAAMDSRYAGIQISRQTAGLYLI